MEKYSLDKNRITAFIFIEDKFYSHELHTECVTEYLKAKGLIKKEEELYSMLKNKSRKHIARQWLDEIEYHCVFGEVSIIDNQLSLIIFEDLTIDGISLMKKKGIERFGIEKMYLALYTGNKTSSFNFVEV